MRRYSRREFLGLTAAGAGALAAACSLDTPGPRVFTHADALIKARPGTPTQTPTIGYTALGLATGRDGFLYVPTTYRATTPAPLVVSSRIILRLSAVNACSHPGATDVSPTTAIAATVQPLVEFPKAVCYHERARRATLRRWRVLAWAVFTSH